MNEHAIELKNGKQPLFKPIYSLSSVESEMLKIYIKTNLANGFICSSKFFIKVSIFFNWKLNKSFCLYVNYCDLNNITIKNRYSLFLIGKLLDWFSQAKKFT